MKFQEGQIWGNAYGRKFQILAIREDCLNPILCKDIKTGKLAGFTEKGQVYSADLGRSGKDLINFFSKDEFPEYYL